MKHSYKPARDAAVAAIVGAASVLQAPFAGSAGRPARPPVPHGAMMGQVRPPQCVALALEAQLWWKKQAAFDRAA